MKLPISAVGAVVDPILNGLKPKAKGFVLLLLGLTIAGFGLNAILK